MAAAAPAAAATHVRRLMAGPLVAFRNFGCAYPGTEQPSLQHIDIEIRPGEFVVLAGPSGSGKTTLAQATNGIVQHVLHAATEGEVLIDGDSVMERRVSDLAGSVGILFQEPESQFVSLYVRDEIAFGPENLLLPRDEILRRMAAVSSRIGIEPLADSFVYELSGGQKQKVAVAAILAMEPKILVLDEPTANLDPQSAREMWQLAAGLRADGLAVLAIEKYLDQVLDLADRLIVLDRGQVRFDGPPRDVVRDHGPELLEELGLWLPQTAELETLVATKTGRHARYVPFTPAEGREVYADYRFTPPPPPPPATVRDTSAEPLLRMEAVSHRYASGTMALQGIDLAIWPDEVVAICGANGSGKTTLVKHFVGLLKPTTGEVEVFGRRTREMSVGEIARHVGFVFQDPEHQFVKDTVADEIRFSLRVGGVPEDQRDAIVLEALHQLDLEGLQDRHPFSLSGGQKRRLSVATATVTRPDVLILDEPTYAQDRRTTIDMMRSILDVGGASVATDGSGPARPTATILVTHDMRLVSDYATRAVVVNAGRIVFDGTPVELFADPGLVARTRLEVPPIIELARGLREDGRLRFDIVSLPALVAAMSRQDG